MHRFARIAAVALLLPALAVAGSNLRYNEDADFAGFRTYAWKKGAPALQQQVQDGIVKMVDRELQARGLSKVEAGPDLYVMTYAFGEGQAKKDASLGWWGGDNVYGSETSGINTSQVRVNTKGTLMIKLVDARTDETVWESMEQKNFSENASKALRKIEKMIARMFRHYPPE
jgi:hypothetical protein